MATSSRSIRRGLPRVRGGEPWPPAGDVPEAALPLTHDAVDGDDNDVTIPMEELRRLRAEQQPAAADAAPADAAPAAPVAESPVADAPVATAPAAASTATAPGTLRRGLPRVAGGDPWPPAGSVAPAAPVAASAPAPAAEPAPVAAAVSVPSESAPATASVPTTRAEARAARTATAAVSDTALRRGLPRVAGGDPWPPAGFAPAIGVDETIIEVESTPGAVAEVAQAAPAAVAPAGADLSKPLPFTRTVWAGKYAFEHPEPVEPKRIGKFTRGQAAGLVLGGGAALLALAFLAVFFTRWIITFEGPASFLTTYPGTYDLPDSAQPGFPAWVQWQHFFNVFLMVLIIRTGLGVRTQQRPDAFWTGRGEGSKKISLTLWLHQSLDILWLVNGVIFVVLLFVTGHWMRIVPTSWEVFPNAFSALVQYISLDWPVEHGWVNYNSLQQIMYFLTVFVAAPLAAITGVRMSGLWPKNAEGLSKAYPVELARALHFPIMLYFVVFIAIHVFLVFSTGALRNLNHMFGGSDEVNWVGFWWFFASLLVIAGAFVAAGKNLVIAPIAKLFGTVSQR